MRGLAFATAMVAGMGATSLAAQTYPDVVRQSRYVPVRDGTELAVNIYRPATGTVTADERLPVIFVFTPYRARFTDASGKVVETALEDRLALRSLIRAGYVVAVADIRGKGASFGARRGFQDRTEALDGRDLIEWLARQDFSSGKVGMVGCSYLGGTAFQVATTAPPSLKAVFVGASDLDKYNFVRRGGITAQFNTRPDEPLSDDLASVPVDGDHARLQQAVAQHASNTPMAPLWYGMPLRDSISHLTGNAFWEEVGVYNYLSAIQRAGIATYFWGNWEDEPTAHSILSAASLPGSRFLAGPGSHCVPPRDFDFTGEVRRYFDFHLKGQDSGFSAQPPVTYWLESGDGTGSYVRANRLPGAAAKWQGWFLSGMRSGTARSANDGSLALRKSGAGRDTLTVRYDLPGADYFAFWAKPMDDRGLSYTMPALASDLRLVGFPVARLRVSADTRDANLFVYLDQVDGAGQSSVVAFGRLALSHRKEGKAPYATLGLPWHSGRSADVAPVTPGKPVDVAIDLTPVARIVPAGQRLRLTIAGADPRQRNLQEIKQYPAPNITVYWGGGSMSRLDLPVE